MRSTIFNVLFYSFNTLACVFCAPALAFTKRESTLKLVAWYLKKLEWLERNIMGLTYEIRGQENLPASGSYIVAAKHQSAYETFKLHLIFNDPAVVLKKELLAIPIWGKFLAKVDPIAIDRKAGRKSMSLIIDEAKRIQEQKRPIVIFPQGTRVRPEQTVKEKPYKAGVSRIQEATGMTIVPMALNSGVFWPKSGWKKKSGTVLFEFLPPIEPGKDTKEVTKEIERVLEEASARLCAEADNYSHST